MKKLAAIIASIVVVLGSGAAYACLVWLPQQVRSQLDAQLTTIGAEFEISYPELAVNPFNRAVTLADVTFQHRHLPLAGSIGSIQVKPTGDTTTALTIANPVFRDGDQTTLRAGMIEIASVDQAYIAELLDVWTSGDRAALERLMSEAPGGALNGVLADNLQITFNNVAFDLGRLTIGAMDSTRIDELSLEGASWTDPYAAGGRVGIDVGLINVRSLDHYHLQQLYRALVEGREDAAYELLMNTPDRFLDNLEVRDVLVTPPAQPPDQGRFWVGTITLENVSAKGVRALDIEKIRVDGKVDNESIVGGIGAITFASIPFWPLTESLKRAENCIGAACSSPEQTFERLVEIVAEQGGLELGGISVDGIEMHMGPEGSDEALYTLHSGDFSIPDFTFAIGANGRPYLENFTLRSEAEESYSDGLFDPSAYPPGALQHMDRKALDFLQAIGEVIRENAVPLKYLESFSEVSLKTDPHTGTASFLLQMQAEQRGDLRFDLSLSGIPENVLTFKDLKQAVNAMLAQGSALSGASLNYLDQGLVDLFTDLIARQSGQTSEQLISTFIRDLRQTLDATLPQLSPMIVPPIQRFLSDSKSMRIDFQPQQPVVLSAIPFLAQTDPAQLLTTLGFQMVANE